MRREAGAARRQLDRLPGDGRREILPKQLEIRELSALHDAAVRVDGEQLGTSEPAHLELVPVHDDVAQVAVELQVARRRSGTGRERHELAAEAGDMQLVGPRIEKVLVFDYWTKD